MTITLVMTDLHDTERPHRAVFPAFRPARIRGSTIINRELPTSLDEQPPSAFADPAGIKIDPIRAHHVGQELDRVPRDHGAQMGLKERSLRPRGPAGFNAKRVVHRLYCARSAFRIHGIKRNHRRMFSRFGPPRSDRPTCRDKYARHQHPSMNPLSARITPPEPRPPQAPSFGPDKNPFKCLAPVSAL